MEIHFIVNEKAGNGKGSLIWEKFKSQLTIPFFEYRTQYSGHALKLARKISKELIGKDQSALFVAVGGDGTIHEVLNGIENHSNLIVGFVKAGSGNDFSRAFPSFQTAQDIEQFLHNPLITKMDCGQIFYETSVNKKFVNNAGIGFDALVARKANQSKAKLLLNKIGLGKLSYGLSTINALFTFKRFNTKVVVDGVQYEFEKVWFVTVCNQPYFGGGMKLSPLSKTDDGKLEVTIVHNISHIKLLILFVTVFFGKHTKLSAFTQLSGNHFQVHVDDSLYFHADGEIIGSTDNTNNTITYEIMENSWNSVG